MPKLSLRQRLLNYFMERPGRRIASGDVQRLVTQKTKYSASNATRRLRELAEEGYLNVEYVKNHSYYWYEPPATRQVRKVVVEDGIAREIISTVTTSV